MASTTRPGGRTQRTRASVLEAAIAIAGESGYEGMTIEAVARRSGIHKTTIYRRWGSVDSVLYDAITERARDTVALSATGNSRRDLVAMGKAVAANLADPVARAMAAAVLSRTDDDDLKRLSDRFWSERLDAASRIVSDGLADGQVAPGRDPRVVVEQIVGAIWFRVMIVGSDADETFVETLVDSAIR